MANNRIYLCNPRLKVRVFLGKTFGDGWSLRMEDTLIERINTAFSLDCSEGSTDWIIAYEHTEEGVLDIDELVPIGTLLR